MFLTYSLGMPIFLNCFQYNVGNIFITLEFHHMSFASAWTTPENEELCFFFFVSSLNRVPKSFGMWVCIIGSTKLSNFRVHGSMQNCIAQYNDKFPVCLFCRLINSMNISTILILRALSIFHLLLLLYKKYQQESIP